MLHSTRGEDVKTLQPGGHQQSMSPTISSGPEGNG
jgi:hypothetical protein